MKKKMKLKILQYNVFLRNELPFLANLYDGQISRMTEIPIALGQFSSEIDIIVLNEVFHKRHNEMLDALALYWPYQSKIISTRMSPETSGVFILSKTPILKESQTVYRDSGYWDFLASKGIKYIKTKKDGVFVHVFATHMQASYYGDSKYEKIRRNQILQLSDFIKEQGIPKNDVVVVSGDFNVSFASQEYDFLTKTLDVVKMKINKSTASVAQTNRLHGSSHEAKQNGCFEEYKKTHVCKCCPDEMLDFVFILKKHRNPKKNAELQVWNEFKATRKICGYYGKNLSKRSGDRCELQNEIEMDDLSDHYPVVLVSEF